MATGDPNNVPTYLTVGAIRRNKPYGSGVFGNIESGMNGILPTT